ncbi:uncharacterized protein LOC125472825 [Pyrus x bretschneideri]|uniref:uncharacterized protein LOC125472825 n=1 Tax=Pyrus x bretschneideri TaxID=225117 RepID=UPI00202EEFD8|nr:uncharacterized protein LOC125472825 [Pyrus x bretschneideri]
MAELRRTKRDALPNQSYGANVNQKLFRGYATTAAVREGHLEILDVLINGGASQQASEEALLEASYLGRARSAEMLMGSDMICPQAVVHALVSASCIGFVDVVDTVNSSSAGCNINSSTESGETTLMICARYKHQECLKILASDGADFGLVNATGHSASLLQSE